jgi:hypothetical protein
MPSRATGTKVRSAKIFLNKFGTPLPSEDHKVKEAASGSRERSVNRALRANSASMGHQADWALQEILA